MTHKLLQPHLTARPSSALPDPTLLTLGEVATLLGVSQATLRRWRHQEPLPVIQIGRTVRIAPQALKQWRERCAQARR